QGGGLRDYGALLGAERRAAGADAAERAAAGRHRLRVQRHHGGRRRRHFNHARLRFGAARHRRAGVRAAADQCDGAAGRAHTGAGFRARPADRGRGRAGCRPSQAGRGMMTLLARLVRYRVAVILGLTLLVASLTVPGFLSVTTLGLGLDRRATIGIIAIGMTVLLIARQIDLSVGSTFALAGITAVMLQPVLGIWPAAFAGVLAGAAAGAFNGLLSVVFKVNALVATLATMLIFRSVAHWLTGSQPVAGTDIMLSL